VTATLDRTGRHLLRAVIDNPGEDLPRLVYADWLQENGQAERAEFVRVQVELAALPPEPVPVHGDESRPILAAVARRLRRSTDPHYVARQVLRFRERALLSAHWQNWCWPADVMWGAMGTRAGDWWEHFTFTRGFVSHVTCSCADWLAHGPAVVRSHPVEVVTLSDKEPDREGEFADYTCRWWRDGDVPPDDRYSWRRDLSILPDELYDSIVAGSLPGQSRRTPHWFTDADSANRALSAACLLYARARDSQPATPSPGGG
jgi:uncharacterized protein (TIGR02996 family)